MELTTERLILREFSESDWSAILAYQGHPLYLRYYEWTERTPEAVREFAQMFLDQQQAKPRLKFQFAVILKTTGQLIGTCGLRMTSAKAREGDIGYELALPSIGGKAMQPKQPAPWSDSDLPSSSFIVSTHGALPTMLVRPEFSQSLE